MFFNKGLMQLIAHSTPSCQVITAKVSESLDHRISLYDRLMIRLHILGCKFCARYRKQLLSMHRIVEEYSQKFAETGEAELSADARQRIKEKLRRDDHLH